MSNILVRTITKHVLNISINRPAVRNAVDRQTADELRRAFMAFDEDENHRICVFSGEGGTFCAGADLKAVASRDETRMNDVSKLGPMGPTGLLHMQKPVICAVQGHCVAGGLELAVWCDLRVMEEDAKMGVLCRRVGVPLIDGGTVRLPRLIGQSRALDLILTGRLIDAAEAKEFGLANRVVPNGQSAIDASVELAMQIAEFPQTCLRNDRKSVYAQWFYDSEREAMMKELERGRSTMASGESFLGASKFRDGAGRHGEKL